MEKKQRFCTYCQTPIENGFSCDKCKQEMKKASNNKAQHAYYLRRKEKRAKLIKENEELKQQIKELKNAN